MEHKNPTGPGLHLGSGQQLQGRTAEAFFVTRDRLLAGLHQQGNYGKPMGNLWETYGKPMGNTWGTHGKHMGKSIRDSQIARNLTIGKWRGQSWNLRQSKKGSR